MKSLPFAALFALALALVAFAPPEAGPAPAAPGVFRSGGAVILRANDYDLPYHVPPPRQALASRRKTATIIVNFLTTFPCRTWDPAAQAAFQYAADIWASLITSSVPIVIDACWEPKLPGILGQAGPTARVRDFSGAPDAVTWYPIALANAMSGSDLNGADAEIQASFNSARSNWYFGTDGNTPSGQYDFVSVVLHEIGHGLGFLGSMDVTAGQGSWGYGTPYPFVYDRFTENGSGQQLITAFPNNSSALAAQLTSDNLFFDGPNANAANGNARPKLYAPSVWESGSSYAHLDEDTYSGTPNGLMTPALSSAESVHDPGPITLGMFEDMGWPLASTPPAPEPDLSLTNRLVNASAPVPGDAITFTLRVANSGTLTATGVIVTNTLPTAILSPAWIAAGLPGISERGGLPFLWDLPDLAVGASGVITVHGTLDPTLPLTFTLVSRASIGAQERETNTGNNTGVVVLGGKRVYLPVIQNP